MYGRALEQLAEAESSDDILARIEEYREQAIELLKRSIELEFADWGLMRTDPDLDSLRDLDEFQTLLLENAQESEEVEERESVEVKPDAER